MEDYGVHGRDPLKEDYRYRSIGGWLSVFLTGIFLRACVGFVDTAAILDTVPVRSWFTAPYEFLFCLVAAVVTGLTFVFFPLCCAFFLFKRSGNAVDLVRIWLLTALGVEIAFDLIGRNAGDPGSFDLQQIGELVYFTVSYGYFGFSKRVRILYGAEKPSKAQIAVALLLAVAAPAAGLLHV